MVSRPTAEGLRTDPGAERDAPAVAVEELLKLLAKASRAYQLYLHNNPTYHRSIELLQQAFAPLWAQLPELVLSVTEHELLWEGRPVYQELERSGDTIAWLLYKDGIRELRLLPGFEGPEVERLLEVLRLLGRAAGGEDDAITLLWDRDFAFLRYRFVEPADDGGLAAFRLGDRPGRVADVEPEPPPRAGGVVRLDDFDSAPFFLAERELDYLRAALAQEYAHDLFGDAVAMLLDTMETQHSRRARDEICAALDELLLQALGAGDYRAVALLLREVGVTLARARGLAPEHEARLAAIAAQLGEPERLHALVDALDVTEVLPPEAELEALFGQLQVGALGPALGALDRVKTARLRAALRAAADRLALAHSAELVRLIGSAERSVAREAAQRAGALRSAAAVPALGEVLREGDGALRLVAAQALAEIGSTGALQELAGALDDEEREVRLTALRAIGARRYRAALGALDAQVRDRRARSADLTEQMALFEAYGALCGDDGVPQLDALLNGRSLLGRRQDSSLRACAAVALGRVASARARAALERAGDERDAVVRAAVQRALRGVA